MSEKALDFLRELIRIYSPSGKESEIAKFLKEYIDRELKPNTSFIDEVGNVVAVFEGNDPSILLSSHMDTVKGYIKIREDEFELVGRGACDAKSSIACFVQALIKLKESNFKRKIVFVGTVEEETTCKGVKNMINTLNKLNLQPKFAIFGEPGGFNSITVSYNGRIQMDIAFLGRKAHAASKNLHNPILKNSYFLVKLNKIFNKNFPDVIFNPTIINSNGQSNVIPSISTTVIDIRFPHPYRAEEILESAIQSLSEIKCNSNILIEEIVDPFTVDKNSLIFRSFVRSILKLGFKPKLIKKNGTGEINIFTKYFNIPAIVYGPGDSNLSHTNFERIKKEDYLKSIEILKNALLELDNLLSRNY